MTTIYIALGSNLADPVAQLHQAVKFFQQSTEFTSVQVSPFYGSKPLGPQDQPDYVNAVLKAETTLAPLALLDKLQQVEHQQGRVRLRHWGERTLDLDILLYGDKHISHPRLHIPHYDMHNRAFVIMPLYDLTPDLILPDGTPIATLCAQFHSEDLVNLIQLQYQ